MSGKHRDRDKEREKRRSRDRSRDRDRDRDRDRRRRSDRERRRSKDRSSRKDRHRSRSKDGHRNRDDSDRRKTPPSSNNNNVPQSSLSSASAVAAANLMRTNFANILNPGVGLMAHELALNPHLLGTLNSNAMDQFHLNAQLMKFNSDILGIGSSSSAGGLVMNPNNNYSERSNLNANNSSCENSQDGDANRAAAEERKRKRKSRWAGGDHDKTFIPGMPTILPPTLSADQQEAYLVQLQIEEISRKLRTTGGDLGISMNLEERSPSPEPIYSSDGKRLNTREFRTRKKLEEQRHQLVLRMQCMNPDFKPPADYKPPVIRVSDKVLIPQEQHPDINFVGLLIGPRGNTLKAMEKETGAKIIIRGKGSVKEGKVGRKDGQPLPGEDEPLHAFITASNPECVKKAVDKIKEVIKQGIEVPEGHNDLRRMQLRELAQLNGTLRETDGPRCNNCGSSDHKSWLCPDKPNVTNNILCSICGGAGHIAKDCRAKKSGQPSNNAQAKIDEEYMSLMAELGEAPPGESQSNHSKPQMQQQRYGLFEPRQTPRPIMAAQPPPPQQQQHQPQQHHIQPPWNQHSTPTLPPAPPPQILGPPPSMPLQQHPPPPMMPWMTAANNQPAPPGSTGMEMYQPPPPPGLPPCPPGTSYSPVDQWGSVAPPGTQPMPPFPWGSQAPGTYIPQPPPPSAPMPPLPAPGTNGHLPNMLGLPPPPPPS